MAKQYDPDLSPEVNLAVAVFALADAISEGFGSVAHRIEELSDTVTHYSGQGFSVRVSQEPPRSDDETS